MTITIELLASPRELSMTTRDTFEIGIVATNEGGTTIDPGLHLLQLFIDGEPSLQFGETVGNGLREKSWFELPPGKSASGTWRMGEILFPRAGTYEIKLRLGDTESALVVVRVDP